MTFRRVMLVLLAATVLVAGCSKREEDSDEVRDLVDATSPNAYRFIYETEQGGEKFRVQGLIEDDLRYKLQLSIDGRPALEQVVVDDSVAVRFLAPGLVERFIDRSVEGGVDLETDVEGASVLDALRAGRWVHDPVGAPSLLTSTKDDAEDEEEESAVVDDPLADARTVLDYVRSINQPFVEYDPESLEPTYRADEDPFLAPEDDSGVTRFDTVVFDLPSPDDAGGGTGAAFPDYVHFRRMAVYEKDGLIFAVREVTRPTERQVQDLVEYATVLVEETAPPEVFADFQRTIEQTPRAKLGDFLLEGINTFRKTSGQAPLRFRTMALEIQDIGDDEIVVTLPDDEMIEGSLAILKNLGRKPLKGTADGDIPSSAGQFADAAETEDNAAGPVDG